MVKADAGWVMVAAADALQPLLSVTVIVYVPALSALALEVVCTGDVDHE
jgi:hypothetical protein